MRIKRHKTTSGVKFDLKFEIYVPDFVYRNFENWTTISGTFSQVVYVAGYTDYQFSGILSRVRVNNRSIKLSDLPTQGRVEIVSCSSAEVEHFIADMKEQLEQYEDVISRPLWRRFV